MQRISAGVTAPDSDLRKPAQGLASTLSPKLSTARPVDNFAGCADSGTFPVRHDSVAALCSNYCITDAGKFMKSLLIIYHSQSGASAQLARAAWRGASSEDGVEATALRVWDAGVSDLQQADGVLLVGAENSASLSGGMKDFLDRTFYPAIERDLVIPYTLLVSAGNDGRSAVRQAQRILSGIPFPEAAQPLILRGEVTGQHLLASRELGQAFAAGLVMGIF